MTQTREDLLRLMNLLSDIAVESKSTTTGSPRDSAVQTLAAMQLHRLKEEGQLSYEEIGNLLGVSRARVFQLHKKLVTNRELTSV